MYHVSFTLGGGRRGQEKNNSRAQSLLGCLFPAWTKCYPFRFHGISLIYLLSGFHTYLLASSLLSLLLARARLFPTRLGRTFSDYLVLPILGSLAPPTSRRFYFPEDCLCEKDLCRRILRFKRISKTAWSPGAKRGNARFFFYSIKKIYGFSYVYLFSDGLFELNSTRFTR